MKLKFCSSVVSNVEIIRAETIEQSDTSRSSSSCELTSTEEKAIFEAKGTKGNANK